LPHTHTIEFADRALMPLLYGPYNAHLTHIEEKLGIGIADRGHILTLSGPAASITKAEQVFEYLMDRLKKNQEIGLQEIDAAIRFLDKPPPSPTTSNGKAQTNMSDDSIIIKTRKKTIAARSPNQALYLKLIQNNPMVFGLGPAGTGKTYLAVAAGVSMFIEGIVERLIFCRPAVEAGERLGFLPGDMKDKVDPYLRPIYDALHDMLPADYILHKIETGDIEIAPLAFMRGRTLSNAFVILDEAQNTTASQMKMFLTRMGESSRMVITGDTTQTDLPAGVKSGLKDAIEILEPVPEIKFLRFERGDVVRHPLVGKIVQAYEERGQ
jgi:phosphate starvation-inducible PhoH-like protein